MDVLYLDSWPSPKQFNMQHEIFHLKKEYILDQTFLFLFLIVFSNILKKY